MHYPVTNILCTLETIETRWSRCTFIEHSHFILHPHIT